MNKMPEIESIVSVVVKGVKAVTECGMDPADAAKALNKNKKSGLVDDYIREYISKSVTAMETGSVSLDSSGERTGRVEKIISKVAEQLNFKKPTFIYKYKKEGTAKQDESHDRIDALMSMMQELMNRVSRIESLLNDNEENMTDWKTLHQQIKDNKKDEEYMKQIYDAFGKDRVEEVSI